MNAFRSRRILLNNWSSFAQNRGKRKKRSDKSTVNNFHFNLIAACDCVERYAEIDATETKQSITPNHSKCRNAMTIEGQCSGATRHCGLRVKRNVSHFVLEIDELYSVLIYFPIFYAFRVFPIFQFDQINFRVVARCRDIEMTAPRQNTQLLQQNSERARERERQKRTAFYASFITIN